MFVVALTWKQTGKRAGDMNGGIKGEDSKEYAQKKGLEECRMKATTDFSSVCWASVFSWKRALEGGVVGVQRWAGKEEGKGCKVKRVSWNMVGKM